jgi:hypothetical protein
MSYIFSLIDRSQTLDSKAEKKRKKKKEKEVAVGC